MTDPLSPDQASASAIIKQQLSDWGLDSLDETLNGLIKDGLGSDAISLKLQDTAQYKQRFSANAVRLKKGLAALTPAQYLSVEQSYRQVLQSYGIPQGFYDSPDDFAGMIGNDLSPDEVKQRAQDAQSIWLSTDEATKHEFTRYYGLSDGAAIASILDPDKALTVVQRMTQASQLAGAAARNGLNPLAQSDAESWADMGVSSDQAQKAFGQIGATAQQDANMAARFGSGFTQTDAEKAALFGDAKALRTQQAMYSAEKGLFSSTAAASETSQTTRQQGAY